jgi:hypothetical protein
MSLKWKKEYDYNKNPRKYTAAQAVVYAIGDAPDYHAGELESIKAELDRLKDFVGVLVEMLPEAKQRDFILNNCYQFKEIEND